jgi:hypothetical protein
MSRQVGCRQIHQVSAVARKPNQQVAAIAQDAANLSALVIVVHDQVVFIRTDGTSPALPLAHLGELGGSNAVSGSQMFEATLSL